METSPTRVRKGNLWVCRKCGTASNYHFSVRLGDSIPAVLDNCPNESHEPVVRLRNGLPYGIVQMLGGE